MLPINRPKVIDKLLGKTSPLKPAATPIPLIAEQFFQELLFSKNDNRLFDLANFWIHRSDEAAFQWGLSKTEYFTQLILIYSGEVNNGGHDQYFLNRSTTYLKDVITALETIGCPTHAQRLQSVTSIARSIAKGGELSAKASVTLKDADQQYWATEAELLKFLQSYLRQNADDILRPERRLPPTLAPRPPLP
jgi:hypothetical protein